MVGGVWEVIVPDTSPLLVFTALSELRKVVAFADNDWHSVSAFWSLTLP